ncbi:hypothetical protein FOMA001_g13799 [Fusarium oxysporum f. sp. matthiolae]|nr:hypothetical protein FOMA001_g13799 [Fusarium oxysporum f. sp. matthiolae]
MSPFPTFPITGGNPKLIITRATRLTVLGHFDTAILQYCTGRALDIEAIMADDTLLSRLKLSIESRARVLICCHDTCRFALASDPAQVSEHLRRKHKVTAADRRQLTRFLSASTQELRDPSEARVRKDGLPYDPDLCLVHGYICKFCTERTASSQVISRHVASNHEEERLRLGVRRKAMYEPAFLQAWTKSPPGGRYWIVEYGGSSVRPVGGKEAHDHLKDIFEREQGRQRLLKEMDLPDGTGMNSGPQNTTFTDLKPWLERTGWEQTFRGFDRKLLKNLTVVPSSTTSRQGLVLVANMGLSSYIGSEGQIISSAGDESRIANLIAAVDAVMDRCEQTARTTSRSLLCWLRSVRPHVCYAKPFTFVGKAASRKQYIRVLKRFIAMVFRAFNLPADIRRRQAGIRLKKSHIRLISALWNHEIWKQCNTSVEGFWTSIKSSTTTDIEDELDEESNDEERHNDDKISSGYESDATLGFEGSENDDMDDGNSEYEDDETLEQDDIDDHKVETCTLGESDGMTSPLVEEVLELLFGLIMEFSTEEVIDGRPASTLLVYFSGILGFTADLNSFLPARSYTSNLAALIYIQRLLFLEYALPARGYATLGITRRPRTGQVPLLQKTRLEYLVLGSQSPFEELFSLLAYGRAIAGSETPAFLLRWSDDSQTVSYKDEISVNLEQFRRLPMTLLERAETLSGQLMYGWKPPCDLSSVKDDISNTTHGFSFVSHPKNDLTEAYLELSLKACTSQASPLSRKGKWHRGAILAFLKKEEALREILADLMLMTCGGQPRSPDLLEVRVRNHGTAERSFYVYNGFMIYVTRSHKAKRSTNREFIVARFFPFQVGQLLYTYLVYIRPFVDMLAREHEPYYNDCCEQCDAMHMFWSVHARRLSRMIE